MNYPGHSYLGPGNPVLNGPPIDEDDRIALRHDLAYKYSSSSDHIREADRQAISNFASDFYNTANLHSLVGAVGLGVKYCVETFTGVLYPFNQRVPQEGPGIDAEYSQAIGMMDATDTQGDEPAAKKQKVEKTEGKNTGGLSSDQISSLHVPISQFKTGKVIFTHSRIMYSYGYRYKCISAAKTTESGGAQLLICTPYARVPCHGIPFYMTNSEFNNLPIGGEEICHIGYASWVQNTLYNKFSKCEQC